MTVTLFVKNIPEMYPEVLNAIRIYGEEEQTRNGSVLTIQQPFVVTVERPWERVLFDPVRDANPFFHVMEFVWMMAGEMKVEWIAQFNKRMYEYANAGDVNAAYGWRWRRYFGFDQVGSVIHQLKKDPSTRQAVIEMWAPTSDHPENVVNDRACNTHIYFRTIHGRLDMTVLNRSNDVVWGMCGANAVHMTMLHELVARCAGLRMGFYHVISNNAHFYTEMPNAVAILKTRGAHDLYPLNWQRLVKTPEDYEDFVLDAETLVNKGSDVAFITDWFHEVAAPMYDIWFQRRKGTEPNFGRIHAEDWRLACKQWHERRKVAAGTGGKDD